MANQHDFTDDDRRDVAQYYLEHGGYAKTAEHFSISSSSVERWVRKYRHQIEYNTKNDQVLKAVSTYTPVRDDEGVLLSATWTKVDVEHEQAKTRLQEFFDGFMVNMPRATVTSPPDAVNDDLMALYILTDAHIGMGSEEWSIELAERVIMGWIDEAVRQAPDAHTGVFCQLGDISHWDSLAPVTPASKHVLDADCSAQVMVKTVIKLVRYCIQKLLEKHQHVHIIMADANHDPYSSIYLREMLAAFYDSEPRVTVDSSPYTYYCFEWGLVSTFFHHGHKRGLKNITGTFTGMFREKIGRTKYSYGHLGHYHHSASSEDSVMRIEIHPTLAGKDDYAINAGYISQRGANTIIYHKKYGEVARNTIRPEMLL